MPEHRESSGWGPATPTDIVYRDPFSPSTSRTRKQLMFFSSLVILNNFYPIDIENSHIIGLKFVHGNSPPLSGLFGVIVIYLAVVFILYIYQEIKSWLAQANEILYEKYYRQLLDIYSHHQSIANAVNSATGNMNENDKVLNKFLDSIDSIPEESQEEVSKKVDFIIGQVDVFGQFCSHLGESNEEFKKEIDEAKLLLDNSMKKYNSAFISQTLKIGVLEIILPVTLACFAVAFSVQSVFHLFNP